MAAKDASLVKRQQIAKASRTMFTWIVVASVVVGAAGVSSVFMVRKALFNGKILDEQNKTVKTLQDNNKAVAQLSDNVRVLNTDSALKDTPKAYPDEQNLSVLLDALPDNENVAALGSSIQQLIDVPGVEVDGLSFPGLDGGGSDTGTASPSASTGGSTIEFSMNLISSRTSGGSAIANLNKALARLEHSIRAMDIVTSKLSVSDNFASLSLSGVAYYQPAVTLDLKSETVKP